MYDKYHETTVDMVDNSFHALHVSGQFWVTKGTMLASVIRENVELPVELATITRTVLCTEFLVVPTILIDYYYRVVCILVGLIDVERQRRLDAPPIIRQSITKQIGLLQQLPEDLEGDAKCCVCMDRRKNVLFEPCLHIVCCVTCTKGLRDEQCPLCRKDICVAKIVYL